MSPVDEGFCSRVEAIYKIWRSGTEKVFRRGQQQGLVNKNVNPKSVATTVVASTEGCFGVAKYV